MARGKQEHDTSILCLYIYVFSIVPISWVCSHEKVARSVRPLAPAPVPRRLLVVFYIKRFFV